MSSSEEWTLLGPALILGVLLLVVLTIVSLRSTAKLARADDARMRDAGVLGSGTVTWVEDVSENDPAYRERILHLDLALIDGRRYEARTYLHLRGTREPAAGDVVRVKVHPDRPGEVKLLEAPFEW
jgi:hypothetical protein